MKNFKNYNSEKYNSNEYELIEEGIYKKGEYYLTSLTFECEDSDGDDGEEASPQHIPQYPLEDLLDKFFVHVNDFYDELNKNSETICYQEFGGSDIENIRELRTIIGKRVYIILDDPDDEDSYVELIIE